jgi:segregation and condensation protein B
MLNLFEKSLEKGGENAPTRKNEIKRILEALLFSTNEPLETEKMKEIIETSYPIKNKEVKQLTLELKADYEKERRAFGIFEVAGGYLLRTVKEVHPFVEILHQNKRGEKLSKAAVEVLAIVAYKQPITRVEIEKIRGVDSSGTLSSLLERELVEIVGRLDAPGRPSQYGITKRFLRHFGLKSIEELKVAS